MSITEKPNSQLADNIYGALTAFEEEGNGSIQISLTHHSLSEILALAEEVMLKETMYCKIVPVTSNRIAYEITFGLHKGD